MMAFVQCNSCYSCCDSSLVYVGGLNDINTTIIIIIVILIRTIITSLAVITPSPPPPLPSAAVAALVVASCYPTSVLLILSSGARPVSNLLVRGTSCFLRTAGQEGKIKLSRR